jgi:hypothetical protein
MGEESCIAQAWSYQRVPESADSNACVAFYSSMSQQLHCDPGPDKWPRDDVIYCIGVCRLREANDVYNGMEVVTSCRPATSLACTAWRQVVGSLGTVAAQLSRVVESPRTVAIHREWAAGLRCTVTVLQSPCSHVLLAFNVPPATRLVGAWRQPCRVASWKICARPDERS